MHSLDTLCADALTHLPSHVFLINNIGRVFLPGATIERTSEDKGRAGDSLAERSVELRDGHWRLSVVANWLDRRDHDGSIIEGPGAPRGILDLRVRLTDERIERANLELRAAGKRRGFKEALTREVIVRAATVEEAREKALQAATEIGWLKSAAA